VLCEQHPSQQLLLLDGQSSSMLKSMLTVNAKIECKSSA
jgi:hypothetical protein